MSVQDQVQIRRREYVEDLFPIETIFWNSLLNHPLLKWLKR